VDGKVSLVKSEKVDEVNYKQDVGYGAGEQNGEPRAINFRNSIDCRSK